MHVHRSMGFKRVFFISFKSINTTTNNNNKGNNNNIKRTSYDRILNLMHFKILPTFQPVSKHILIKLQIKSKGNYCCLQQYKGKK